jgi:hypothetical protein
VRQSKWSKIRKKRKKAYADDFIFNKLAKEGEIGSIFVTKRGTAIVKQVNTIMTLSK